MKIYESYKKECNVCRKKKMLLTDFNFYPSPSREKLQGRSVAERGYGGFGQRDFFSPVCFDCTPLAKSASSGAMLRRPPTYREVASALSSQKLEAEFPSPYFPNFREHSPSSVNASQCSVCRGPSSDLGPIRKRGSLYLCPRCFACVPGTVRTSSKAGEGVTYYPYMGVLRRFGPHTWQHPEKLFKKIANSYHAIYSALQNLPLDTYDDQALLGARFELRRFRSMAGARIAPRALIDLGHYLYRKRLFKNLNPEQLLKIRGHVHEQSAKGAGLLGIRMLIQYLLGDSFPYPEESYRLIHLGALNRGAWSKELFSPNDPFLTPEEVLGVLLCPRVLPPSAMRAIILLWSGGLIRRVHENKDFWDQFSMQNLVEGLAAIQQINSTEVDALEEFRTKFGYTLVKISSITSVNVMEITPEDLAIQWAKLVLYEKDEWWLLIQLAELIVLANIREALKSTETKSVSMVWDDIVRRLLRSVVKNVGHPLFSSDEFDFPVPVEQPTIPAEPTCDTTDEHERSLPNDEAETLKRLEEISGGI